MQFLDIRTAQLLTISKNGINAYVYITRYGDTATIIEAYMIRIIVMSYELPINTQNLLVIYKYEVDIPYMPLILCSYLSHPF